MNDEYIDRLIQGHLDDCLTPQEHADFEGLLLRSEVARQRFWELAEVHGLAKQAIDIAWPAPGDCGTASDPGRQVDRRQVFPALGAWLRLHRPHKSAATLTAGVAIGVLTMGVAWAIASVPQRQAILELLAENFEFSSAPKAIGISTEPELWSGDLSEIVGPEQGVQPLSGGRMLKYLRADYPGKLHSEESYCADLYRLVDLRPYRDELAAGATVAELSAMFNTSPFPDDERYISSVGVYALPAEMASNTSSLLRVLLMNDSLAMARKSCPRVDRNPQTWENVSCSLQIPADADVLLLHLSISHSHSLDYTKRRIDFDGHYLDNVQLTLKHPAH